MNNASNEKDVARVQQKHKNERAQELADLKKILNSHEGFRFFKGFFKAGNLHDISMSGNSWTYFNEGHRNFAKIIFSSVCEAAPQIAAKIISEVTLEQYSKEKSDE